MVEFVILQQNAIFIDNPTSSTTTVIINDFVVSLSCRMLRMVIVIVIPVKTVLNIQNLINMKMLVMFPMRPPTIPVQQMMSQQISLLDQIS